MRGIGAIIVVLVILAGGWYLLAGKGSTPSTPTTTETINDPVPATTTSSSAVATSTVVTYSNSGFSPKSIIVAQGGSVKFINQSSGNMWVASNPHPSHTGYSGTTRTQHCPDTAGIAFDECMGVAKGGSYMFTFQKLGTWGFHNHARDEDGGSVTVVAK